MSLGKNHVPNRRRSSRVVWIIIGVFLFALVVFPYFGNNFRYLISSSLSPLQSIGQYSLIFGAIILIGGIIIKRSKVIMVGIMLLVIGLFLGDPVNIISLFTGGSPNRGYHFFS
jgi:uncharacterized membrane protein YczE